jgi:hypothetical protein
MDMIKKELNLYKFLNLYLLNEYIDCKMCIITVNN